MSSGTRAIYTDWPTLDRPALNVTDQYQYLLENRGIGFIWTIQADPVNRYVLFFTVDEQVYAFVYEMIDSDPSIAWHGVCVLQFETEGQK